MEAKLTELQAKFVEFLFDDDCQGDIPTAAKKAGYEAYPRITEDMRAAIVDKANTFIAAKSAKAAFTLAKVLEPGGGEVKGIKNTIKASTEFLDRAGLSKLERVQIEGGQNMLVILPEKKPVG